MVRELDRLRAHLGYERVHVLGHSNGAAVALEYYRAHPARVKSLILGGPAFDAPAYERHLRQLVRTLSDSAQRAIRARETDGNFDAPDFRAANEEFAGRYVFRRLVQPDADSSFATVNAPMYRYMWGPTEFTVTGTLRSYDATPFLRTVAVPTLFVAGEHDLMDPTLVRRHAAMTPNARIEVIPGAGHFTTWDAPEETNHVVRAFLRAVDAAGTRP
jgi:proline iminopeptidase